MSTEQLSFEICFKRIVCIEREQTKKKKTNPCKSYTASTTTAGSFKFYVTK